IQRRGLHLIYLNIGLQRMLQKLMLQRMILLLSIKPSQMMENAGNQPRILLLNLCANQCQLIGLNSFLPRPSTVIILLCPLRADPLDERRTLPLSHLFTEILGARKSAARTYPNDIIIGIHLFIVAAEIRILPQGLLKAWSHLRRLKHRLTHLTS